MIKKNPNRRNMERQAMEKKNDLKPLDVMVDGIEHYSIVTNIKTCHDVVSEIKRSLNEIKTSTGRINICYAANTINSNIRASTSIDTQDDLAFTELISSIPAKETEIDIILVTPGGSAQQVAKFVEKLRPRFHTVNFIIPHAAMSAGTIFAMSGNKIFMGPNSHIGPIDPQVLNRDRIYVPAQALMALVDDINKRGELRIKKGLSPNWTDIQIINQIDYKELGAALTASQYSVQMVKDFLINYKFRDWTTHSSTGQAVTLPEKMQRAEEIAGFLCNHNEWKSHGRGINRDIAERECKIKIDYFESVPGLERAVRRFWALIYYVFENSPITKMFISENYNLLKNDPSLIKKLENLR